jgi:LysM repeat protein
MKKTFLSLLLLSAVQLMFAQSDMMVRSGEKGLYLEHKVTPKENFYSIGRLYSLHPKEIAAYNKLDMTKGLNLGQTIRIPLTASNFSQAGEKGGLPVYYKLGEKEGLMKVSNLNNNVSLESLRRWNNLKSDNVNPGSKLVVGFVLATALPYDVVAPVQEKETMTKKNTEPVNTNPSTTGIVQPKIQETVVKKEPVIEKPKTQDKSKEQARMIEPGHGYFKSSFDLQVRSRPPAKNETVTSGIFKTSSGWEDAKYYLLVDGVQPGTIIKLVNPGNNKAVYAKVLGEMSGIRQNEGLNIRISNAAAAALGVEEDDKFIVKMNY